MRVGRGWILAASLASGSTLLTSSCAGPENAAAGKAQIIQVVPGFNKIGGMARGAVRKNSKKAANSSGLQNGKNSKIFPMETSAQPEALRKGVRPLAPPGADSSDRIEIPRNARGSDPFSESL